MAAFQIRFNKTRGMPNRGSVDHVWRVFEDGKEYITKHVEINVPCRGEKTGDDWSMCCEGKMTIDRATSTATIDLA
jgi:hypothetical protein